MRRVLTREEIPADVLAQTEEWQRKRNHFDPTQHAAALVAIFKEIAATPETAWDPRHGLRPILSRFPKDGKGFYSKADLIAGYRHLVDEGDLEPDPLIMQRIRMKPMRTQSGVAPVTVLTAPAGCPGKCIFCPDDWRMPKSYIYDEPGCQRAERDGFDPFRQTLGRIHAFESIGHNADKVELLILGGTWSAYSKDYQEWFIRRCYDAMNMAGTLTDEDRPDTSGGQTDGQNSIDTVSGADTDQLPPAATGPDPVSGRKLPGQILRANTISLSELRGAATLEEAQAANVHAQHRNVGLVVETRPDWVTPDEIRRFRRYGVTKVQIGVQSLDDEILDMNKRGHKTAEVRHALGLLRTAGFKLHLHWMPNLFGATPAKDRADFARFFEDPAIRPDELKIYPCSLIAGTELYARWEAGEYHPYTERELVDLLADIKPTIPPYTRVNRLFRDIPAHHIAAGVRLGNLREVVHAEMARRGVRCGCIRCNEVKRRAIHADDLTLQIHRYTTDLTEEHFLHFVTGPQSPEPGLIAGFLRLSLPHNPRVGSRAFLDEIADHAMIREVHVYGPALTIGSASGGQAQHAGLGSQLLTAAQKISRDAGFRRISVIAATGTRDYYAGRGFAQGELYMSKDL